MIGAGFTIAIIIEHCVVWPRQRRRLAIFKACLCQVPSAKKRLMHKRLRIDFVHLYYLLYG